ncbi:type-F conjugative transfer system protein TraW [Sphingopyxis terrae]|uniref:type-F conjugative transfer system protein TraW n=1 Tax=Sphingopyxis terrae TaxID=33052 RepID=UPI000787C561|nr:type-F conjugative transfer system protein TraW [Sphingopyxis terrae]
MKQLLAGAGSAALLCVVVLVGAPRPIEARDYGRAGHTFPVIEPDLLSAIEARLERAKATGELARINEMFAKRVEATVRRPVPVAGVTPAVEARVWDFDPTVRIERDIHDQKGNLVAAAGQRINPLDFVAIRQDLVFIDGDDSNQVAWATNRYTDLKAKIIFINGSPIERMSTLKRRFYFDQGGKLTAKFGIEHTPAVVRQVGRVMRVSEEVLKKGRAG